MLHHHCSLAGLSAHNAQAFDELVKELPVELPEAFPLNAQYKGALAAEEDNDNADDDQDDAALFERKPKAKRAKPL